MVDTLDGCRLTAAFFAPARNDVVACTYRTREVEIVSAVWRVAAPGMRDLFVNGERVSATALPPCVRATLEISYADGVRETVETDEILGTDSAEAL